MIPVPITDLAILAPLIQERIEESKLDTRITMDRALNYTHMLTETRKGVAFVDNLSLPTAGVILQIVEKDHSIVFEEKSCTVILIFISKKSGRRSLANAMDALKSIEKYARDNGCDCIYGSAWLFEGADGIGKLWEHAGYKIQETVYRKSLN
jgi:hypothetical protein